MQIVKQIKYIKRWIAKLK